MNERHFCLSFIIPHSSFIVSASGSSSVGRASAFQAEGREFEPRLPLQTLTIRAFLKRPSSSGVERLLGKEEVTGSNPVSGLGSLKHSSKEDYSVWRRRSLTGRSRTST